MSNYQITGVVRHIGDTETVGTSGFRKRIIAIDTQEQYPQTVGIQFVQNNVDKLDGIRNGEVVDIEFNVKGNEYNGKYYVTLQGWKIASKAGVAPPPPIPPMPPVQTLPEASNSAAPDDDDLPF